MRGQLCFGLAIAVLVGVCLQSLTLPTSSRDPAMTAPNDAATGLVMGDLRTIKSARTRFFDMLDGWREFQSQMHFLRERYQAATPEKRRALCEEENALIDLGREFTARWRAAAEEAYSEDASQTEIGHFLRTVQANPSLTDNYEETFGLP
jgi:hypothetical protein